jgi:iron(III) transport system substrate-binding protein
MKKGFVALAMTIGLVGCAEQDNNTTTQLTQPFPNEVVVYSARAEHLIKPLFDEFTKQTGIGVKFQTGNANALVERLKAEGDQSPADILMTVDAGNLWYAASQNLFQPLNSAHISNQIPAHLRDPNNLWTGLSVRARTIVYSSERVDPQQLSRYEDLGAEQWKGRLCLRTSGSVYNKSLVAAMIAHDGEQKTEQTLKNWVANLAAKPQAKDSQVLDAILAGQCDVGIVNTYYFGRMQAEKPDVALKLFWANQATTGTHINVSGAGILKNAKNREGAVKLLEWLASDQAQGIYGALNKEYPANPKINVDAQVDSWGRFKQDNLNLSRVGELQQAATMLINRAGYE